MEPDDEEPQKTKPPLVCIHRPPKHETFQNAIIWDKYPTRWERFKRWFRENVWDLDF